MDKILIALKIIVPLVLLILLGVYCRKKKILTVDSVLSIKALVTKIMLPILIFNILATTEYSFDSIAIFGVAFLCLALALLLGFKTRGFMAQYGTYSPFLMSCSETGMVGYALLTALLGSDNLSYLATMDLASTLFGFTIFITLLSTQTGGKQSASDTIHNMLHTPSLIASILGIIASLCGLGTYMEHSQVGLIYKEVISSFTTPMSSLILITIGFDLVLDKKLIRIVTRTILSRFLIMGLMLAMAVFFVFRFTGYDKIILVSLIIFFTLPPTFVVPIYVKEKDQANFVSTCISVYIAVTMLVFTLLCIFIL